MKRLFLPLLAAAGGWALVHGVAEAVGRSSVPRPGRPAWSGWVVVLTVGAALAVVVVHLADRLPGLSV